MSTNHTSNHTRNHGSILIIDDDPIIVDSLSTFLTKEGHNIQRATTLNATLKTMSTNEIDVVITDMNMPDTDGFEILRVIKQRHPDTNVIMITGYGTIESAVEAIKLGAYDYLTKPIMDEEISLVVQRAAEQRALVRQCAALRSQLDERFGLDAVIGHDYKMLRVYDLVEAVSASNVNVLVEGESGTGKSMIARVVHHRSQRRDGPFIEVSCGALPESLLESELFGHKRGAFTGAVADKPGKFKAADGGTIFLDEIDTASPGLQVKLLRVLQEREFEPVGDNTTEKVDVRVILATNKNLEDEVATGRFRQDLFYRINVVTITLPPMSERLTDIRLLAESFLQRFNAENNKRITGFTDDALDVMQRYNWPGNVRELVNAVERAVVLTRSSTIDAHDLPPRILNAKNEVTSEGEYRPMTLKASLAGPEKRVIEAALKHNDWCRQATADQLNINRTTLYKKMKHHALLADPVAHG